MQITKVTHLLICNGPEIFQEFFTNNKFDKHPNNPKTLRGFLGNGILSTQDDKFWQDRRKVISTAFYKAKLVKFLIMAR